MNLKDLPAHSDKRGNIQMVLENTEVGSVSRIESAADTWRARHYHPKDTHWILINEGQIEYYERPVGKDVLPTKVVLNKGDLYFTPSNFEHEMVFPCHTVFDCYSKLPRNQANYETETIRFNYSLKDIYDNRNLSCRLCGGSLETVWDFGQSPLANAYKVNAEDKEYESPLSYAKCSKCSCVQLKEIVDPKVLFDSYSYETPDNLSAHFEEFVESVVKTTSLPAGELVVDIGSNNGLLLSKFKDKGFNVIGVEPSNVCSKAVERGIYAINRYWSREVVHLIGKKCKLIVSTNTFAHVPDLDEYVKCLLHVLDDDGCFVFENAYLLDTITNKDFGQFYAEHCYLHSVTSLQTFFAKHGLEIFNVEHNEVQMGSIRCYVKRIGKANRLPCVLSFMLQEHAVLQDDSVFEGFTASVNEIKDKLIKKLSRANGRVCVYGWPAKMTLMNKYFGLERFIEYIVDDSFAKVGKYAPGTNLKVYNSEHFKNNPTNSCLIGAYNFATDIILKNSWYKGEWINPLCE